MTHAFKVQHRQFKFSMTFNKLISLIFLLVISYFGFVRYISNKTEQTEASAFILAPQVNDIYFLDVRLLSDKLERKEKYKLAKVVRVSGDNVGIVYGRFFYQWQYAVVNSIQYGDLSNNDYFKAIPDYISFSKIKEMKNNRAIYLVKRPTRNKLYGNFVSPE
ncbi:MAG: hypothetical protein ACI9LM_000908 [Alteromonadaceae bacterium]